MTQVDTNKGNKQFKATLIFGEEATSYFVGDHAEILTNSAADMITNEGQLVDVEFNSQSELDAYLQGVDTAWGWMDYLHLDPQNDQRTTPTATTET